MTRNIRRKLLKLLCYAFAMASLCLSANCTMFLKYILKVSERHLNRNFMSSGLIFCAWRRTHAPTLMECEVNADNSFLHFVLYSLLAASCRRLLMWISSIRRVMLFPLIISVKTAIGYLWQFSGRLLCYAIFCMLLPHSMFCWCYPWCRR